eukprot:1029670-Prymnesium_polylepis.1
MSRSLGSRRAPCAGCRACASGDGRARPRLRSDPTEGCEWFTVTGVWSCAVLPRGGCSSPTSWVEQVRSLRSPIP